MSTQTITTIEELVQRFRQHALSRGRFIAALAALGASSTAIATLLSSAESHAAMPSHGKHPRHTTEHRNKMLHQAHIQQRRAVPPPPARVPATGALRAAPDQAPALNAAHALKLDAMMADYAEDAVVDDPLYGAPFVGKAAIRARKHAEAASGSGFQIEVAHRFAHQDQVVAEWIARGRVQGGLLGPAADGKAIAMRGITVVTRNDAGKITRESFYYDLTELHRQLTS